MYGPLRRSHKENCTPPKNRDILFLYRGTILMLAFCLNRGFKGFHRFHGKLYTARKNKIVHIFIDNQWFSAEKLYTSFTGVQFCQATKARSHKENFTLPGKIKLYTFLLIINGLVLKNFTLPVQVYNFVTPLRHEVTKKILQCPGK